MSVPEIRLVGLDLDGGAAEASAGKARRGGRLAVV